jgi:signal peptidase I
MTAVRTRIADGLLTVAAVGGLVCIVAVVMAAALQISLIMFKTGSMSPTIPVGAIAVVREVPAAEARVGDVVTVERGPGELPVTHRVIHAAPMDGGLVSLELKGDANPGPDAAPYVVDRVRLVLVSVPLLGYAVAAVSTPWALGGITLAAAALVTWAFWPHARRRPQARHEAAEAL